MQVRLLGPVDVTVEDAARPVHGLRRKAILSVLALHRGEIVSTDRLIDVVWNGAPRRVSANTLQSHVSYLRSVLGYRAAIVARAPGYVLELEPGSIDVEVVKQLVSEGSRCSDPTQTVTRLKAALSLWRGRSLIDVGGLVWLEQEALRLDQLRLQAIRSLAEARLALGEHIALVPELEQLSQEHPVDEQIHGQLILALYRAGRQADALAAFQRLRHTLRDELGIDPGKALCDLELAILRQDAALVPAAGLIRTVIPAQLPLAGSGFSGRAAALAGLDTLLAEAEGAVVATISGAAGVGKTALAVHWAHRVASRFPDGQLYVNLRGFDAQEPALEPGIAMREFLQALGIGPQDIPAGVGAQTALYRSLLAGKRILVILDNARDAAQVRPLLPATAGCLAVVTSREELTGLVAEIGAYPVPLGLLAPSEAHELLAKRLGERVGTEQRAVDDIVRLCAGLPLALTIVAARAATRPDFPLQTLAAELTESVETLDVFDTGDPATDMRSVLSWSYQRLSLDAARLFRLFGLHSGPDMSLAAAASLAGLTPNRVRSQLAELTRSHLAVEHLPGRFALHDLVRTYANERATAEEPHKTRHAARLRLVDHYVHSADHAARLLFPPVTLAPLRDPAPGVTPERPSDLAAATGWFAADRRVLMALVDFAARSGLDSHVDRLARAVTPYFHDHGLWPDQLSVQRSALNSARHNQNAAAQANAHRLIAVASTNLGRHDEAAVEGECALDLYAQLGEQAGQGESYLSLAAVSESQGNYLEAIEYCRRALKCFAAVGDETRQAQANNTIGWCYLHLGEYDSGFGHCQEALSILQQHPDPAIEASTWDSLGYGYHRNGETQSTLSAYRRSMDFWRLTGDSYCRAQTASCLGDALADSGERPAALQYWREAWQVLERLNHPEAERLQAKLSRR